jgi:hypothetical protein
MGVHTWEMRNTYKILIENLKGRKLEVDKRTINNGLQGPPGRNHKA